MNYKKIVFCILILLFTLVSLFGLSSQYSRRSNYSYIGDSSKTLNGKDIVGDLGGKLVQIPNGVIEDFEWNHSNEWGSKSKYSNQNIIASFGMRYNYKTKLLYDINNEIFKKQQYDIDNYQNGWIDIGIKSGKYYSNKVGYEVLEPGYKFLNARFYAYTNLDNGYPENLQIATGEKLFGLDKYSLLNVDPRTNKPRKHSKLSNDMFVFFNDDKDYIEAIIFCPSEEPISPRQLCRHYISPGKDIKITLDLMYRRENLQNWKVIQQDSLALVNQFIKK